jgi:protocatechuate 3,4-dioxygenase beta subunit
LPGGRELTTQFYLADHPLNARDFLYRRMSAAQRDLVTMRLGDGPDGPQATVDILL